MSYQELREAVAMAIAQADEQNGGPHYEYRIALGKHAKEHLFDEADAAIAAVRKFDAGGETEIGL